jgi:hypothetical protein
MQPTPEIAVAYAIPTMSFSLEQLILLSHELIPDSPTPRIN